MRVVDLVADGHVRVVITTNFEKMMEQALQAKGIEPQVVSTDDLAEGMLPLHLQKCLVIKVHGDYIDSRIRNTVKELERLGPKMETLLDRVLDEFGLIVCGWSATRDPGMRAALERVKSRRFSGFWCVRGTLKSTRKGRKREPRTFETTIGLVL